MPPRGKLLLAIYIAISSPFVALGFAALFSRKMGFRIPFVSTEIIPALHDHAVWGETLRGRAILLDGEDWFFLIMAGFAILLAVLMLLANRLIQSAQVSQTEKKTAGNGKPG